MPIDVTLDLFLYHKLWYHVELSSRFFKDQEERLTPNDNELTNELEKIEVPVCTRMLKQGIYSCRSDSLGNLSKRYHQLQ